MQKKTKKAKKISIRKHLPLTVRVHYDMVRNFSPVKLFGVGMMMFVAVFGVLLATQVISPRSSAIVAHYTEVKDFRQVDSEAVFKMGILSGFITDYHIKHAKYFITTRADNCGAQNDSRYSNAVKFSDTETAPFNTGSYVAATGTVSYIPRISNSSVFLCLRVAYGRNGVAVTYKSYHGPYPVNVITSLTNFHAVDSADVRFNVNLVPGHNLESIKYYNQSSLTACSTDLGAYTKTANHQALSGGSANSANVTVGLTASAQRFCVAVEHSRLGVTGHSLYGPYEIERTDTSPFDTIPGDTTPPEVTVNLDMSGASWRYHARVSINQAITWKYVTRGVGSDVNDRPCNESVFDGTLTNFIEGDGSSYGGSGHQGGVINAYLSEQYNGTRYICFQAEDRAGNKGYGETLIIKLDLNLGGGEQPAPTPAPTVNNQQTTTDTTDTTAPVISIAKVGDVYTASANEAVNEAAWDYRIWKRDAAGGPDVVCNDRDRKLPDSTSIPNPRGKVFDNTSTNFNDRYYVCFAAQDQAGNWGRGYHVIATKVATEEPPEIVPPEAPEAISNTGVLGDEGNWTQFGGYILIAGAMLGMARILIVKKYKKIS